MNRCTSAKTASADRRARRAIAARRAGRKALRLATDHRAVSHVVFFIVSAAIFIPVVGGMFLYMQDASESLVDPSAGLGTKATSVLHQLTNSPGLDDQNSIDWQDYGNNLVVVEAGLRRADAEMLDYNKLANLQAAGLTANGGNAFLDYEELKTSLRLDDSYDFHLRMYPLVEEAAVDPYGTLPIQGRHVAYFANLTNPSGRDDSIDLMAGSPTLNEFLYPTDLAVKEIAALSALGLGTGDADAGFDGKFYQPISTQTPVPYLGNPYIAGAVKEGDVIADTIRPYNDGDGELPYTQLFWERYLKDGDEYRYDALVFGGGVNLQRWADSLAASSDPNILTDYVNSGGTVIFMGRTNDPGDFVTQCTAAMADNCLFWQTGSLAGTTTVDETNQMLATPNQLTPANYARTDPWLVCDNSATGGVHEEDGFIPVIVNGGAFGTATNPSCYEAHLGATSSDRYGQGGGTIIINSFDLSSASIGQSEVSRVMANFLSYGVLRTAYLDFGPSIPNDAPVESATRLLLMEMPDGEYMDIRVILYLWRN